MAKLLTAAAVVRFKPDKNHRREISDGGAKGLRLVVEPSGTRSWTYRYRRPGSGTSANLRLGRFDASGREHDGELRIGDPLSLAGARALAAECERQRLRGRDPAAEHQLEKRQRRVVAAEREASTFAAAVRAFCDGYKVKGKGRKPRGWIETARVLGLDYRNGEPPTLVPKGLAERWASRPITEITGNDIRIIVDEALERGIPGMQARTEGESDARARKLRDSLGSLFGWLCWRGKITVDPCIGVWRPPAPKARERVLNTAETRWLWAACDKIGSPFGQAVKLLLLTGARLNEIGLMKWTELPDDLSELRLPSERTKNSRPHNVPMVALAQSILRSVPKFEGCDHIISATGKGPTGSWSRVKRALDAAMLEFAKAERGPDATIGPFVLHDLRRSCASGMQQIGIRTEVIERALNHASGVFRGVSGVYQRDPLTDDVRAALERWARHIEGIVSDKPTKVVDLDSRRA